MTMLRTYATFAIRWPGRGSTWSGYDSRAQAEDVIAHSPYAGEVVESRFDIPLPDDERLLALYRPSNIGLPDREAALTDPEVWS